jgi:inosine-uridine nucleoside N-ribohydrolase
MGQLSRKSWRAALFCAAAALCAAASAAEPVRLIFDTDMGNDVDDALALAVIHALQSRGEAMLLAVTVSKDNRYAAPYVDLDGREAPDAVSVLRRVLAAQSNGSVVMVVVGFSTNLARLLDSAPDAFSPLRGAPLAAQKVRLLSAMAGRFPSGDPEYNVKTDIPSARKVFEEWPSPIVFSGFEIGNALKFPATSIENDFSWVGDHPVAEAYRNYMRMPYDRPTWDLTAALYAVRPASQYFSLSPAGRVTVDEKGQTVFTAAPDGQHRFLVLEDGQKARTLETLVLLASQPR